jgi:hypothetical protein
MTYTIEKVTYAHWRTPLWGERCEHRIHPHGQPFVVLP